MSDAPLWEPCLRDPHPPLRGSAHADVAIVGGGLTGVTCAAMLAAMDIRTVLLEAEQLGRGATWNCTGKVTSQLGSFYQTVADKAGLSAASQYARLMREAVSGVAELCQRLGVPTQEHTLHVFAEVEPDVPPLRHLHQLEVQLGLPVRMAEDAGGCPFPVEKSLALDRQLLVAPLPYLMALARFAAEQGCIIHEDSPVRTIEGRRVVTDQGSVEAETILLATGSPVGCTSLPRLSMMRQRTCQTLYLEGEPPLLCSHLSIHADELTLRPLPGGALLAWDMGPTGSKDQEARQVILERTLRSLLPDMRVRESHARQDVFSGDGLPIIGPIRPQDSHILMATGYSGWGLCNSYLAARILTGHITGRPLPEAALFRPDRPSPKLREGLRTAGAYLSGLTRLSAPTCPHMGGKLRYSPLTGRWECPCHGSTFEPMGQPLDAPAMTPAEVSAKQR